MLVSVDMSSSNGSTETPQGRFAVFHEPIRVTLTRTVGIATVAAAIAALWAGGFRHWPGLAVLMLWPAFGGHWVDVFFLNVLRPNLPPTPLVQRGARLATWFVAGVVLALGARLTAGLIFAHLSMGWLTWPRAGLGFVGVELVTHAALHRRGRASFYDGLG